ncbi:MAG TPA: AtpZ/AtpI family protein [Cryomorphaceae bacterium]|nr:AtpZ/AtpI family protein [Cryomorphaceae bacterium]
MSLKPKPDKKNPNKDEAKRPVNDFYKYSGMAIQMGITIAAAVYGGVAIDEKLKLETPWFTLLLSLIGVGAAIYIVIRTTSR